MKAIKHDKAVALLACGFMFAATAGLVVSGLNKSEEIAQTAGVESFEKVDSKEMNNVLSLERMDNILAAGKQKSTDSPSYTIKRKTDGQQ